MATLLLVMMRKSELRLPRNSLTRGRESSTASITSSILEYRKFQGRTYHSDRHPTEYFTPNDEQQSESIDIK